MSYICISYHGGLQSMTPAETCKFISSRPGAIASLLLFAALMEARRYKWEESQRIGHDVGQQFVVDWFKDNWLSWYRDHWVEHVRGRKFWDEFGTQGFDLIHKLPDDALVHEIVGHIAEHGENLGIIIWADNHGMDMNHVVGVLKMMDINGNRAELDDLHIKALADAMDEADRHKWLESERAGRDLGDEVFFDWFKKHWAAWYDTETDEESR